MLLSLLLALGVTNFTGIQDAAKEAIVVANMCTVQLAFEDFAVQSDGWYPDDGASTTPRGQTAEELCPDVDGDGIGDWPINPFTGRQSILIWDADPSTPGDLGANPANTTNYVIKGCDRHGEVLPIELGTYVVGPQAYFVAEPAFGPSPLLVSFTNISMGSIDAWHWDFGNGSQFDGQDPPPQTYQTELSFEDFTVTLTVTGPAGSGIYSTVIQAQGQFATDPATWGQIKAHAR
jgi:PKD repeat protein